MASFSEPDQLVIGKTYYVPLEEFLRQENVLVIPASEIKDEERIGDVPAQGYVWVD